ncbi:MAG: DUF1015 domain-containing protein [Candidatus Lokiarchaeota archaeon]|nr:DUF1015 domain-containing protein [Candidatus Lokiarchaeota archaeon]
MPELIPFRNFHYKEGKNNPKKLEELVAPPYDVITKEEEIELKKKDPNNITNIILPDSYNEAGKQLDEMINSEILVCGEKRCFCIYGIDYIKPDTKEKISRYGFVGLLKLVEIFPANDGVIPHEATFRKYTTDRLNLIQKTDANFSPLFMIYNGNGSGEKIIKKSIIKEPYVETIDRDGFVHKVWEVSDEKDITIIKEIIKKNSIIIADGHHRYVTSLRHSKHGGCKYIMTLFIDFNDPGLIIYTSHRQIHKLSVNNIEELKTRINDYFEIEVTESYSILKELMENKKHVFGLFFKDKYIFLKLKENIKPEVIIEGSQSKEWKNLDIPILHNILLEKCLDIQKDEITFIKDINKGILNVKNKKIETFFIVNPTTLEEVHKITHLGEIMPQKSTYFYPKPLSGLIIHKHTDKIE